MFYSEHSGSGSFVMVEQKEPGIHESGKQMSPWLQYAEALSPYGGHIRHEQIRNRVENQIEALCGKCGKIRHVATNASKKKTFASCDLMILFELLFR
jgi:hypothetical protein